MNKLFTLLLLVASFAKSQNEPCATMPVYYQHLNNNINQHYALAESKAREWLNNPSNKNSASKAHAAVIKIPVVFHVVYKNATQNIHDSLLYSQLAVLNECFRKQNPNYINTRTIFDTLGADTEIEFCLASTDPLGNPTTGIVRKQTASNSQFDPLFGFDNIKKPSKGGDTAWANSSYLNIWVGDMSLFNTAFVLGYATFPGSAPALDGVVIQWDYMGKYAKPNFLGRTTVHEVGHWFGMRHIWADDDNGQNPQTVYCDSTDFVDDTPNAGPKSSTDCNLSKNTCSLESTFWSNINAPDMVENYMDYSSDACMTMFTKGQKARMYSFLNTDPARMAIKTSSAACNIVTSVNHNNSIETSMDIFPVPASNEITFKTNLGGAMQQITIYNAEGKLVLSESLVANSTTVNTTHLPEGIYYAQIVSGNVIRSGKFLIKR
jgi:hypothetical protein